MVFNRWRLGVEKAMVFFNGVVFRSFAFTRLGVAGFINIFCVYSFI